MRGSRKPVRRAARVAVRTARLGTNASRARLTVALGGSTRTRVVTVLAGVLALSSADAATVGAAAIQLRQHLHIDNTDIGLLVTVSSLVGAIAAIPFGMLADHLRRTWTLSFAVVLWGPGHVVERHGRLLRQSVARPTGTWRRDRGVRSGRGVWSATTSPVTSGARGSQLHPHRRADRCWSGVRGDRGHSRTVVAGGLRHPGCSRLRARLTSSSGYPSQLGVGEGHCSRPPILRCRHLRVRAGFTRYHPRPAPRLAQDIVPHPEVDLQGPVDPWAFLPPPATCSISAPTSRPHHLRGCAGALLPGRRGDIRRRVRACAVARRPGCGQPAPAGGGWGCGRGLFLGGNLGDRLLSTGQFQGTDPGGRLRGRRHGGDVHPGFCHPRYPQLVHRLALYRPGRCLPYGPEPADRCRTPRHRAGVAVGTRRGYPHFVVRTGAQALAPLLFGAVSDLLSGNHLQVSAGTFVIMLVPVGAASCLPLPGHADLPG